MALALCGVLAWVLAAQAPKPKGQCNKAKETTICLLQLPAKVKQTLLKVVGKTGKIDEIEKCVAGKVVSYSADVTKNGRKFEVEIAADGKLIKQTEGEPKTAGAKGKERKDVEVALTDLPQAVRDTLMAKVGDNGKVEGIWKEVRDGKTVYSAEFTEADGEQYDIVIAEDGTVVMIFGTIKTEIAHIQAIHDTILYTVLLVVLSFPLWLLVEWLVRRRWDIRLSHHPIMLALGVLWFIGARVFHNGPHTAAAVLIMLGALILINRQRKEAKAKAKAAAATQGKPS